MCSLAGAQLMPSSTVISSGSGQFSVNARGGISPQSLDLAAGPGMVTLDPALLAVSCERVKAEVLHELNLRDQWRGKIFVVVRPARSANDQIVVVPERFAGNWHSGVELPDAVDRNRFVEAIVRATLLEIANRNAGAQPTEIPEWLVRGMARQLMGASAVKLILPPPRRPEPGGYLNLSRMTTDFSDNPRSADARTRKLNPLAEAVEVLRTNEPLTFEALGWPTEEQLDGANADVFGCSAQLFVSELLKVKRGPECLGAMLSQLPGYLNWQLAFQHAFEPIFKNPLEAEKWWALQLSQFNGRDLLHLMTREESARQLDAVFQFPVQVQIGLAAPMRTDITLQTIIRGWNRARQLEMLKNKIWELGVLRPRVSPECVPLIDQYSQVLQDYYKKRSSSTRPLAGFGASFTQMAEEAATQLDALDVRRADFHKPAPDSLVSALEAAEASVQ